MASALEQIALNLIPKLLANLPPEVSDQIGQIMQIGLGLKAQLDRIENQNRLIIGHLKIPAETEISEQGNGREPIGKN